jgi:signal transduction histidine kinase
MLGFQILLLFTSFIFIFLSIYSLQFRKTRGALIFSALMLAGAFYSFGYSFEVISTTVEDIRFWLYIEYIGIPAIPSLWLIFALQFTGKKNWLTLHLIILMAAISLTTLLVNYTNNFHHWFYKGIEIDTSGTIPVTVLIKGNWYWVHIAYSNIAILIGNLLFIDMFLNSSLLYRRQALIMLTGSLGPWIGHLIYLFGLSPHSVDMSPVIFVLSGIIYTWGMFHYRILDLVPIAIENVFLSMREGVVLIDRKKRVINFNPSAGKLREYFTAGSFGKYIDKDFNDLSQMISPVISGKSEIALLTLKVDGNPRFYQVRSSPILNQANRLFGWTIIFNDVTKLQEIEQSLRDSERKLEALNATRDKFFRIISHDLRNPFSQLLGLSDIIRRDIDHMQKDELISAIGMIYQSASTGYKLAENLLTWANAQTDNIKYLPGRINVKELILHSIETVQSQAESKMIRIDSEISEELTILADYDMADLILRNLITNAIKFTNKGGSIRVNSWKDKDMAVICVSDNGIGISSQQLECLFLVEKIYSTPGTEQEKGTGLGLMLSKEFVEKNNGKIWVKSEPGKGSEFFISFPLFKM